MGVKYSVLEVAVALMFSSVGLRVGSLLAAVLVMHKSLVQLVIDSILK